MTKVHDFVVTEQREKANKMLIQNFHSDVRDHVSFIESVGDPVLAIKTMQRHNLTFMVANRNVE